VLSPTEIETVLLQSGKTEAIKIYNEQTGVSLKEAKDAVEEMGRRLHISAMRASPTCAGASNDL
jgi:ribosomal protein L7/L12